MDSRCCSCLISTEKLLQLALICHFLQITVLIPLPMYQSSCHDVKFEYFDRSLLAVVNRPCSSVCPPSSAHSDNQLTFCSANCQEFDRCLRRTLANRLPPVDDRPIGSCSPSQYYDDVFGYSSCTELCDSSSLDGIDCGSLCPTYRGCILELMSVATSNNNSGSSSNSTTPHTFLLVTSTPSSPEAVGTVLSGVIDLPTTSVTKTMAMTSSNNRTMDSSMVTYYVMVISAVAAVAVTAVITMAVVMCCKFCHRKTNLKCQGAVPITTPDDDSQSVLLNMKGTSSADGPGCSSTAEKPCVSLHCDHSLIGTGANAVHRPDCECRKLQQQQ
jgi:hypothetical protein